MNFLCKPVFVAVAMLTSTGAFAQSPAFVDPAFAAAMSKLAYVPRQGTFFEVHRMVPAALAELSDPSIKELGDVYRRIADPICSTNPDGRMDNWYGLVHAVSPNEQGLLVELRVSGGASVVAAVADGTDLAKLFAGNGAGSWMRFNGQLLADGESCVRMAPPLSVQRLTKAVYAAKIETAEPVDSATADLLEAVVPSASPWRIAK